MASYVHLVNKTTFFIIYFHLLLLKLQLAECPSNVMVKTMDYGIVVSEFEFQSRYYVHFWANTLGKGMNALILSAMG